MECKCQNCEKVFSNQGNLNKHRKVSKRCKERNGQDVSYHCHYCDYHTIDKSAFEKHTKTLKCRGICTHKQFKQMECTKKKLSELLISISSNRLFIKKMYKKQQTKDWMDITLAGQYTDEEKLDRALERKEQYKEQLIIVQEQYQKCMSFLLGLYQRKIGVYISTWYSNILL